MFKKTKKRVLTRRGVIWLGQTCNQRCYFCYFAQHIADRNDPLHQFMTIDKAKSICRTLRYFYGNTSIDIQGGEPTIFGDILEIIRYCREIGLYPTLITNGLVLAKPGVLEKYREAGVRDFLVSLHGFQDIHDEVVGVNGAYGKIVSAIERMRELNIPFRFNCTMSKPVIPIIPEIAKKAIEYGAYAVNYIAFNPFGDQEQGRRTRENVAKYSDIGPRLIDAMGMLENAGVEVNVRYLPFCMTEQRFLKNFYNYQQLSYDTHEWDYQSWLWTMLQPQMQKDGLLSPPYLLGTGARYLYMKGGIAINDKVFRRPKTMSFLFAGQRMVARVQQLVRGKDALYRSEARQRALDECKYRHPAACANCAVRNICDGFHGDYIEMFGEEEAVPVKGMPPVDDPAHFIKDQEKTVEPEDESWAL